MTIVRHLLQLEMRVAFVFAARTILKPSCFCLATHPFQFAVMVIAKPSCSKTIFCVIFKSNIFSLAKVKLQKKGIENQALTVGSFVFFISQQAKAREKLNSRSPTFCWVIVCSFSLQQNMCEPKKTFSLPDKRCMFVDNFVGIMRNVYVVSSSSKSYQEIRIL